MQYYTHYFVAQKVLDLRTWESFQLALMFLLISPLFYFWSTFVFPETTRCSRLILHLPFIHF